jgi:hypothetical protein
MSKLFILVIAMTVVSCGSEELTRVETHKSAPVTTAIPSPTVVLRGTPSVRNALSEKELCRRLGELKKIPYEENKAADDPIYDGLMIQGTNAVPCLIEKVTDAHVIEDPREGDPHIQGFTVGDAAVFMLMIITGVDEHPEAMLPPEFAKQWDDRGIYSYFAYVEKPQNRRSLQFWWRNWAKKNLK